MAADRDLNRPHIVIASSAAQEPYTYPLDVRGSTKINTPPRDRASHSSALLAELARAKNELERLHAERRSAGMHAERGMYLTFESEPEFDLAFKSLDRPVDTIELVAIQQKAGQTFATVFVPEGRLGKLVEIVRKYETENDKRWGKPKNRTLVESISHIQRAALESFCTDEPALFPKSDKAIWWEVWLRAGSNPDRILRSFSKEGRRLGLLIAEGHLRFLDRTVVLVHGTVGQMARSVELLDCIAELRLAKESAEFFTDLSPREQGEWVQDYARRIRFAPQDSPAVCILDTGVTRDHPLLAPALDERRVLTCNPDWGGHDHHRHGTEMAGLALHGDLTEVLQSDAPRTLEHVLESVKILPRESKQADTQTASIDEKKDLYGRVTLEAVNRVEVAAPRTRRAFSLAVTTDEGRDRGLPSSWSAAVDKLCAGSDDGVQRLFVISAGNVPKPEWAKYPDRNDVDQAHDPGQAWNALTVGACTEKFRIDAAEYPGWKPIAAPGTLSPSSTTSTEWPPSWPNKPDLVLEGGNGAMDSDGNVDSPEGLSLLSTHFRPTQRMLAATGDTSGATAQAARLAAILMARYPALWPETIRGLLVHSAEWTQAMRDEAKERVKNNERDYLLRHYGYGVPDLERASWSATNALTLVAQDALKPFQKTKSRICTQDMNLHELPWPREELLQLFSAETELRVTLSYYIEPNPARRGWKYKHRYASHGLRFKMRNPGEPIDDFRKRVTKDAQDEEQGKPDSFQEPGWKLNRSRNRGSIHSDIWTGAAADLADRHYLAVYPVGGWWKERSQLGRWKRSVRYALIVSIKTPATGIDIYTPVANMVAIPTEIEI